jgi:hypothetical protein
MATDPDIQQAWTDLRAGLTSLLRPHVAEISLDDLVKRAIAEHIAGPGWRPPLRPPPQIIRDDRIQKSMEAP